MEIKFICPYWGQEGSTAAHFFRKVLEAGYDGVEINMPESPLFVREFQSELNRVRETKKDFVFIAQQVLSSRHERVPEYIDRMKARLEELVSLKPDFINSHTGKDYFSFEDNCRAIEVAEEIGHRAGVRILHETHRGRFAFHASSLLPYLERFPKLQLTADFSHWCTVSESMLDDQQELLEKIIPFVYHLHARVGHAQAPQVSDPFAPEWKGHRETFMGWWRLILETRRNAKDSMFTICPEFGPVPYMPTMPITEKPLSDQWVVNVRMRDFLQTEFDSTLIPIQ